MKNVHEIEVTLGGEKWSKCLDNAFKKAIKDVNIDGFRKGSVPKDVYLKHYKEDSLYPDAINEGINIAYKDVLEEHKLTPVVEAEVDVKNVDHEGVTFVFKIITKPDVKLSSYKNLGVKKEKAKVTKEELAEEIDHLRDELAEIVVKENGEVSEGDTVVIDFDGFIDGMPFAGGSAENYSLEIGSGSFIPGFEEGLIGHKTDEEVELKLKFPEDYTEDLRNKDVTFKVKIHEIKTKVLPELNQEFYDDLGLDVKSEEEFTKALEKKLLEHKEAHLEEEFIDKLLAKAAKNLEVEINPEIIEAEVHRIIEDYESQLKNQGLSLEQYYHFTNTTYEDLHKQVEKEAIKRLKYRYIIEYIAEEEKVDFSEKEVNARAKEMADNYGITVEELIEAYGTLDVVKYDMKMHRAIEILKESNEKVAVKGEK